MEENRKNENLDTPQPEFESNAARRLRLMGIENDDKIHDTSVEITKGSFFANLWYKHKWALIIAVAFALIGIVLICTYAFRDKPDMKLSYCGPLEIGTKQHTALTQAFENVLKDYNGDGEIELTITSSLYRTGEEKKDIDREYYKKKGKEFDESKIYSDDDVSEVSNTLRLSKYNFILIDKELYDKMKNNFLTLEEILGGDAEKYKDIAYDDCGIYFMKTSFAKEHAKDLTFVPSDTIVAICKPGLFDKNLENECDLLKAILEYEAKAE